MDLSTLSRFAVSRGPRKYFYLIQRSAFHSLGFRQTYGRRTDVPFPFNRHDLSAARSSAAHAVGRVMALSVDRTFD